MLIFDFCVNRAPVPSSVAKFLVAGQRKAAIYCEATQRAGAVFMRRDDF